MEAGLKRMKPGPNGSRDWSDVKKRSGTKEYRQPLEAKKRQGN